MWDVAGRIFREKAFTLVHLILLFVLHPMGLILSIRLEAGYAAVLEPKGFDQRVALSGARGRGVWLWRGMHTASAKKKRFRS